MVLMDVMRAGVAATVWVDGNKRTFLGFWSRVMLRPSGTERVASVLRFCFRYPRPGSGRGRSIHASPVR